MFGARINSVTTTLAFTAPVQRELSGSKTWVDPAGFVYKVVSVQGPAFGVVFPF